MKLNQLNSYSREGERKRTKETTFANESSSRSHALLQIKIEKKKKKRTNSELISEKHVAKLSLIDLAGSERATALKNKGSSKIS
jgi:kinesin family member 18/19